MKWSLWSAFLCCASAVALVASLPAQNPNPNERDVPAGEAAQRKGDVWTFDFRFKDPRIVKVKVGGEERLVWYLWYQIVNRTDKARSYVPLFELVSHEPPAVFNDELIITAEDQIKKIEDPTGYLNIKNSIRITQADIPVSLPPEEAFPRAVTGVALWDAGPADPKKRDPNKTYLTETRQFSIFIRGLSNATVLVDAPTPDLPPITQNKTLQLKFRREGDLNSTDARDIRFVSPAQWIYRNTSRITPTAVPPDKKGEPDLKNVDKK